MAFSTTQNFGIPTGTGTGRGGMLQPKVKNKFRVIVTNFGIPTGSINFTSQVMTCSRPQVNFNPVKIDSYNSSAYYQGKAEWEPVSITLRDDISNSIISLVDAQLQKQMNFIAQTTPAAGSAYKFQTLIQTMGGGDDDVIDEWFLEGCFLASSNMESFDYASADQMTIELSVRYDNATQTNLFVDPVFNSTTDYLT